MCLSCHSQQHPSHNFTQVHATNHLLEPLHNWTIFYSQPVFLERFGKWEKNLKSKKISPAMLPLKLLACIMSFVSFIDLLIFWFGWIWVTLLNDVFKTITCQVGWVPHCQDSHYLCQAAHPHKCGANVRTKIHPTPCWWPALTTQTLVNHILQFVWSSHQASPLLIIIHHIYCLITTIISHHTRS